MHQLLETAEPRAVPSIPAVSRTRTARARGLEDPEGEIRDILSDAPKADGKRQTEHCSTFRAELPTRWMVLSNKLLHRAAPASSSTGELAVRAQASPYYEDTSADGRQPAAS